MCARIEPDSISENKIRGSSRSNPIIGRDSSDRAVARHIRPDFCRSFIVSPIDQYVPAAPTIRMDCHPDSPPHRAPPSGRQLSGPAAATVKEFPGLQCRFRAGRSRLARFVSTRLSGGSNGRSGSRSCRVVGVGCPILGGDKSLFAKALAEFSDHQEINNSKYDHCEPDDSGNT